MAVARTSPSIEVKKKLNHPIIDTDGHMVEFLAPIEDYVKAIGGTKFAVRFPRTLYRNVPETNEQRRDKGRIGPSWWNLPAKNTLDRATAALPKLLHQRLDEMGIDFTVLFPTHQLGLDVYRVGSAAINSYLDPEVQRIRAKAVNTYQADICREYSDRMTPVAEVVMVNPKDAMEDLEQAVKQLGLKVISISSVYRPIKAIQERFPEFYSSQGDMWTGRLGARLDTFGIDSEYNYDPFWAKCVELKVPVMDHNTGLGWPDRNSPSNYMFNRIGAFTNSHEAICKSLLLGGVTRRFPTLKFAFLEGGATWACRLYTDMVNNWKKRNRKTIHNYNPANLDRELLVKLYKEYGDSILKKKLERLIEVTPGIEPENVPDSMLDEWAPANITRPEDFLDLYVKPFYFGCEGDDPANALAFKSEIWPLGAKLKAMFSSDLGHWDVPDMREILAEAYELVEHGLMNEDDFRKFTFSTPVELFAGMNRDFFKGTVLESQVAKELRAQAK